MLSHGITSKAKCLIVLLIFLHGCIDIETDSVVDVLNRLVTTLGNFPENVDVVVSDSIDQLEEMGTDLADQIANELILVSQNAFEMSVCKKEFTVQFLRLSVIQLRHDFFPERFPDPPTYRPWVCATVPNAQIDPSTDTYTHYTGFFFTKYQGAVVANIEYHDGTLVSGHLDLAIIDDTSLSVDFQNVDWEALDLDSDRSPRLVLKWEGGRSELLINARKEAGNKLYVNEKLFNGQYLDSGNGHKLYVNNDGLRLINESMEVLWEPERYFGGLGPVKKPEYLILQSNGDLVLYSEECDWTFPEVDRCWLWHSETTGVRPDKLVLKHDGSLVLYKGEAEVWRAK